MSVFLVEIYLRAELPPTLPVLINYFINSDCPRDNNSSVYGRVLDDNRVRVLEVEYGPAQEDVLPHVQLVNLCCHAALHVVDFEAEAEEIALGFKEPIATEILNRAGGLLASPDVGEVGQPDYLFKSASLYPPFRGWKCNRSTREPGANLVQRIPQIHTTEECVEVKERTSVSTLDNPMPERAPAGIWVLSAKRYRADSGSGRSEY